MPLPKWFRRKKKKKHNPWDPQEVQPDPPQEIKTISFPKIKLTNPFAKKYRITYLLRAKRFLAAFLLIINAITFVVTWQSPAALFFFLSGFIMLDYLWKTRRAKTLWKE